MRYGILAAGEGSRLVKEGINVPKPLVKVCGEALIDRLIRIFLANEADEIDIITNDLTALVKEHVAQLQKLGLPIKLIVKTTPSSMHSFRELANLLGDGRFCLTTVDTIFNEEEFKQFIEAFSNSSYDGMMAVTEYIDDESPLYISTNESDIITGFYDKERYPVISGGIYCLDSRSFDVLNRCIESGQSRMRNFQRALVNEGMKLKAYRFSKILDVDHADDVVKAEEFLNSIAK